MLATSRFFAYAQNDKLSIFHLLSGHDTRACEEECSFFVNPGSERGDLLPGDFCYPVVEANEGVAEKASEPRQKASKEYEGGACHDVIRAAPSP